MLRLTCPAFIPGGKIPKIYTCDGNPPAGGVSPPLIIEGVPEKAKSLALIVDDPDAPMGTWVHWIVWNIKPSQHKIEEDSVPNGAVLGTNSFNRLEYGGPCPPSGIHRYFFRLYALDKMLDLPIGIEKDDLLEAMDGHILKKAQCIGKYERS